MTLSLYSYTTVKLVSKHDISKTYSPMTIVTGKSLDYDKHLQHEFGTYVQAHTKNDPTNQMTKRAIDGIYLRPNRNRQGGHIVMNLTTDQAITRNKADAVPLLLAKSLFYIQGLVWPSIGFVKTCQHFLLPLPSDSSYWIQIPNPDTKILKLVVRNLPRGTISTYHSLLNSPNLKKLISLQIYVR